MLVNASAFKGSGQSRAEDWTPTGVLRASFQTQYWVLFGQHLEEEQHEETALQATSMYLLRPDFPCSLLHVAFSLRSQGLCPSLRTNTKTPGKGSLGECRRTDKSS